MFVVITGAVVVLMMLGLVGLNALLTQSSFKIDDLQTRVDQLTQSYEERQLQAAQLSSPARISAAATKQGLTLPQEGITVLYPQAGAKHPRHHDKVVGGTR